jgi:hypothetical protein
LTRRSHNHRWSDLVAELRKARNAGPHTGRLPIGDLVLEDDLESDYREDCREQTKPAASFWAKLSARRLFR